MKNPLPLLMVLGLGGFMMGAGGKKANPQKSDELPTSLDYSDPELCDALDQSEDEEEDCEEDDE